MTERNPDALGWSTLLGFGAAAVALGLLATPALLALSPAHRVIAVRVLAALYALGALPRLVGALSTSVAPPDMPMAGDPALPDPALRRLAAQLRALRVLHRGRTPPLLLRLRGIVAENQLPTPPPGRSERAELDRLLATIEDMP